MKHAAAMPICPDARVAEAVLRACRMDVQAMKPGNVSLDSPGHGMTAEDFLRSASAVAPVLATPGWSLGERVLKAVQTTRAVVDCNTNLGIVLLAAPLAQAALEFSSTPLRERLARVLSSLDVDDSEKIYQAIRLAAPAGLGSVPDQDVAERPDKPLLEIMRAAEDRDRIAWQYAHDFEDIFGFGLARLRLAREHRKDEAWATVSLYLGFLARFPDTHIQRKFGRQAAVDVSRKAQALDQWFLDCPDAGACLPRFRAFDTELKSRGCNPGTSADMTVATLLAAYLGALGEEPKSVPFSASLLART